ncbi:MAG: hypothetical protein R3E50_14150 [Halioglobus sp.]
MRVLENPSCRWSTRHCQAASVNPFAPDAAPSRRPPKLRNYGNWVRRATSTANVAWIRRSRHFTHPRYRNVRGLPQSWINPRTRHKESH